MKSHESTALERIVFFSDAIFAIAITLLVLEVRVPELLSPSEPGLRQALAHLLPRIMGFVFSFLVIAAYWEGHHALFEHVRSWDRGLLWRNSLFLMTISFIPFPTAFFSEYYRMAVPLIFYAAVLAVTGLTNFILALHVRAHHMGPDVPRAESGRLVWRTLAVPSACLLSIALTAWSLGAARLSLILIPLFVTLFDRTSRRRFAR